MQNKKLTLDYLFKRGGKLAPGDVYEFGGLDVTVTKSSLGAVNIPQPCDSERFIKSLAMRGNEGAQPVNDDFPVFIEYYDCNDGEDGRRRGVASSFDYVKDGVKVWWPDIETLTKQQNEESMEKLTSSEIDWQKNDVMAILEVGTNEIIHRYDSAAHHEDSCVQYSVMRDVEFVEVVEIKTVRDAIIHYKAENSWDHIIYMDGKFKGCDFGEWGQFSVCTGEQFHAEVKAMSHFDGVHAFNDYIEYENELLEPEPLVYIPEVGEKSLFKKGFQDDVYYHKCFIVGKGEDGKWLIFQASDGNLHQHYIANGVYRFKKPETRTPEQIKNKKLSDYLEANKGMPVEDLAREILAGFCGDNE